MPALVNTEPSTVEAAAKEVATKRAARTATRSMPIYLHDSKFVDLYMPRFANGCEYTIFW